MEQQSRGSIQLLIWRPDLDFLLVISPDPHQDIIKAMAPESARKLRASMRLVVLVYCFEHAVFSSIAVLLPKLPESSCALSSRRFRVLDDIQPAQCSTIDGVRGIRECEEAVYSLEVEWLCWKYERR
jgi:hypothetical protein